MATLAYPATTRNGQPTPLTLGDLAAAIDQLAHLRAVRAQVEAEEQAATAAIKTCLSEVGLTTVRTESHVATLAERVTWVPDPARLYATLGPLALDVCKVQVEAARRLIGSVALESLSARTTCPTLTIRAR